MTMIKPIKKEDIKRHVDALSKIGNLGDLPEEGFLRASWSPEETEAMYYILNEAIRCKADKGDQTKDVEEYIRFEFDGIGNLFLSKGNSFETRNKKPRILVGSHLDTVPEGGNYDGAAGIIVGLEAIKALEEMKLSCIPELVVWRGEESATYNAVYKGSKAAFGIADPKVLQNKFRGKTLEEAIREQKGNPGLIREGEPTRTQAYFDSIVAHLELHIEQGRVLEEMGVDIGIVTSIRGPARYRIIVEGEFDHSGNTPMNLRKDANLAIAHMQVRLDQLARDYLNMKNDLVQTIGVINSDKDFNKKRSDVYNNALTKVSGFGYFTLDIRSNDNAFKEHYLRRVKYILGEVAEKFNVGIEIQEMGSSPALEKLDLKIQEIIEKSAAELGYTSIRMASGAGHDAAVVAQQQRSDGINIPTGMIFIPCKNGKSHCKEEYASVEAITKGADVLTHTLYMFAK